MTKHDAIDMLQNCIKAGTIAGEPLGARGVEALNLAIGVIIKIDEGNSISALAADIHQNAVAHGWWEGGERNFGEIIALCHSELSEALEEYRNGNDTVPMYYKCTHPTYGIADGYICEIGDDEICPTTDPAAPRDYCPYAKPEGIATELADCIIRILDFCEYAEIDIESVIKTKREYNKTRPYKHGGKKC